MTKEQIRDSVNGKNFHNEEDWYEAMELYAKQEAILFSEFKTLYRHIEGMNVRHDQNKNHNGQVYTWVGDSDDVIWDAYKKGQQIKRYFEK